MVDNIVKFLKSKDYIMVNDNLGHGSFGKTVLLRDPFIDELFVAKKYEPEYPDLKEKFFSSFLQEIKILYKLNHLNIVRVYNYYAYQEQFTGFIIMENIDGQTIDSYFANYIPMLYEGELNGVFLQLISAFDYLERNGVIHRDIREGNIMIDRSGNAKVIDFGLGKFFSSCDKPNDSMHSEVNRAGLEKLPAEYYKGEYTSQTDMFYLAELYARLLAQNGLNDEFEYWNILEKMLEDEPEKRYSSFAEISNILSNQKLEGLEFQERDKKLYRDFSSALFGSVKVCIGEKVYVEGPSIFMQRLRALIQNNLLEEYVQKVQDFFQTVLVSNCKYYPNENISVEMVRHFYNWFGRLHEQTQKIVFSNLIYKLSTIESEPEVDIPF